VIGEVIAVLGMIIDFAEDHPEIVKMLAAREDAAGRPRVDHAAKPRGVARDGGWSRGRACRCRSGIRTTSKGGGALIRAWLILAARVDRMLGVRCPLLSLSRTYRRARG
jgi:hypothetical protein